VPSLADVSRANVSKTLESEDGGFSLASTFPEARGNSIIKAVPKPSLLRAYIASMLLDDPVAEAETKASPLPY
jgi:hypothetical protein